MQLNAIFKLEKIHGPKRTGRVLSILIPFTPLVWRFSTNKSIEKIENLQKRCLRLTHSQWF